MDWSMIIIIVVVVIVVVVIGGGLALLFFMGGKPKKLSWNAKVYQLGDGVIKVGDKKKGYRLSELKPYTSDIIIKIDKKDGATHYWLQKLKKPVPVVTADCVEVWGHKQKEVKVLLQEDSTTLLKMGYDRSIAEMIFRPMDHDRINMIKTELSERNARIENTRDILTQITPFIVAGIAMLGLVVIAYFNAQAGVKISEYQAHISDSSIIAQKEIAGLYVQGINCELQKEIDEKELKKEEPPHKIPP